MPPQCDGTDRKNLQDLESMQTTSLSARRRHSTARLLALLLVGCGALRAQGSDGADPVAAAIGRAGDNAVAIRSALESVPPGDRGALRFLIAGMPTADLRTLSAEFLLDEVAQATSARRAAPWGDRIPDDVFLDAVLPYAHVTETREAWRADLRARCLPLIEGCATPSEATRRINEQLFKALGVRYSTARRRADQSPAETIGQGVASCTGLSILLADACRSVGIPARLAGIAEWPGKGGNHTWVEVWDFDGWHFVGAAEPDPKGLDRAWFAADAARAVPGDPRNGIWALAWGPTGSTFPLVWRRGEAAAAVDVTARYLARDKPAAARLEIDVRDGPGGPRVPASVWLITAPTGGGGAVDTRGPFVARDERADTNDHLAFDLSPAPNLALWARFGSRSVIRGIDELPRKGSVREFVLPMGEPGEAAFREAATAFFATPDDARATVGFPAEADAFVAGHEATARLLVEPIWRAAPLWDSARADFAADVARTADRESAYTTKTVGERGPRGYGLVIAMHGGGGVPKQVNDSQWRHMQIYYREHGEEYGYRYVALRAPNDAWNGFYDDAIAPLIEILIRNFVLFGDVDPDRVIAIGYSHGGYGAFVIGPKIPDRFAAVHASASAPSDGETMACNLRNLRFSFMVGGKDTAYGRFDRCNAFDAMVNKLREDDPTGYPVRYELIPDNPHTGLPDRDKLAELLPFARALPPQALTWQQTDDVLTDQFWVRDPAPSGGAHIDARIVGDTLSITAPAAGDLVIGLDRRLLGERQSIEVERDGASQTVEYRASARTLCEDLLRRSDPALAFPMRVTIPAAKSK